MTTFAKQASQATLCGCGEEEVRGTLYCTVSIVLYQFYTDLGAYKNRDRSYYSLECSVLATVLHLVQVHKYTDALINEPFGCHVHVMLGF